MRIRIDELPEPELCFGNGCTGRDPRRGMSNCGPFGVESGAPNRHIELGLVAPTSEVEFIKAWLSRMHCFLLNDETNIQRFHEFPGVPKALRSEMRVPDDFVRPIDDIVFASAMSRAPKDAFEALLELYSDSVKSLYGDRHPECILVAFPEEVATFQITNPRLSYKEQRLLEAVQRDEDDRQGDLFEPTPQERKAALELLPRADELLYRNFHRALKAGCMMEHNCVPIQVLRRHTYIESEAKQSEATRAWNLAVALYYKSGQIPWRPSTLDPGTCFVGISFHHLKQRSGDVVYASVAQAFSSSLEPFALKGGTIPSTQTKHKRPYLKETQAEHLMRRVVDGYKLKTGDYPRRIVVHKTTQYDDEEIIGFRAGALTNVSACDLVAVAPTGFRLLKRGTEEPRRGTLCTIHDSDHFLFTTGFVPWWKEYPGPHIPAPLSISFVGDTDVRSRAEEILALTKMNWNSADGIGRFPITLTFAKRVGTIMTELADVPDPNPLYRFYM